MSISHAPFLTARATMDSRRKPSNIFGWTLMMEILSILDFHRSLRDGLELLLRERHLRNVDVVNAECGRRPPGPAREVDAGDRLRAAADALLGQLADAAPGREVV